METPIRGGFSTAWQNRVAPVLFSLSHGTVKNCVSFVSSMRALAMHDNEAPELRQPKNPAFVSMCRAEEFHILMCMEVYAQLTALKHTRDMVKALMFL